MRLKTIFYLLAALFLIITGIGSIVFLSFNIFLLATGTLGSWSALGILIYYLLTSVPAYQGIGAWIARGLSFWKSSEKATVALEIETSLNSAQEEINSEATRIIPYPAKVEWVDKPSYLDTEEEVVIIRMKEHEENPRNVAYAVIDYISKGMIPFSRLYIEKPIQIAIDSTMIKKILLERDEAALDYFLTNVLNKELGKEGVQRYLGIMDNLNKHGLFTRVYLEEVKELGLKLYPIPDQYAIRETKHLVKQLNVLASRKSGEMKGADPYIGKRIKVTYLLVANPDRLKMEGHMPYILYALHCIQDGAEAIYLLSRGRNNKPAEILAEKVSRACGMRIVNRSQYEESIEGFVVNALCIELRSNKIPQST
jgi:hypothetical protein